MQTTTGSGEGIDTAEVPRCLGAWHSKHQALGPIGPWHSMRARIRNLLRPSWDARFLTRLSATAGTSASRTT